MKRIRKDEEGIALALASAKLNTTGRFRISSLIVDRKGRVIAEGHNSDTKTHPLQAMYAEKGNIPNKLYLHSEIKALVNCKGQQPHTIYVARIWRDGTPALAKPCPLCSMAIKESGVRKVVYTLNENEYITWEVEG